MLPKQTVLTPCTSVTHLGTRIQHKFSMLTKQFATGKDIWVDGTVKSQSHHGAGFANVLFDDGQVRPPTSRARIVCCRSEKSALTFMLLGFQQELAVRTTAATEGIDWRRITAHRDGNGKPKRKHRKAAVAKEPDAEIPAKIEGKRKESKKADPKAGQTRDAKRKAGSDDGRILLDDQPLPDDVVASIIGKVRKRGEILYKVQWDVKTSRKSDHAKITFEPRARLSNSEAKIHAYEHGAKKADATSKGADKQKGGKGTEAVSSGSFQVGSLVWCQMKSSLWWPAKVLSLITKYRRKHAVLEYFGDRQQESTAVDLESLKDIRHEFSTNVAFSIKDAELRRAVNDLAVDVVQRSDGLNKRACEQLGVDASFFREILSSDQLRSVRKKPKNYRTWIGKKVRRHFPGHGWAIGSITHWWRWIDHADPDTADQSSHEIMPQDNDVVMWHVEYPDGDQEDVMASDIERGLLDMAKHEDGGTSSADASSDLDGQDWVGRIVRKYFPQCGWTNGKITQKWDSRTKPLWHVVYADGDEEDLSATEVTDGFEQVKKNLDKKSSQRKVAAKSVAQKQKNVKRVAATGGDGKRAKKQKGSQR